MNSRAVFKGAGVLIAFLLGSGFATGQEVLQFFASHGDKGLVGAAIAFTLCAYIASTLFSAGQKAHFRNSQDVFTYYGGVQFGRWFTWYTMIVVYGAYCLMVAGGGAVLNENHGTPIWVGSAILSALTLGALFFGLDRLMALISLVGPLLIVFIISISLTTLLRDPTAAFEGASEASGMTLYRASEYWWWSGALYAALQGVAMFSFLPAVGSTLASHREAVYSATIGIVVYFVALVLVVLALFVELPNLQGKMIPMLQLAQTTLPIIGDLFTAAIMLGIFSTIAPLLWVVLVKFTEDGSIRYRVLTVALSTAGFFASQYMPFDQFINIVYPTIGYSGMLLVVLMAVLHYKELRGR